MGDKEIAELAAEEIIATLSLQQLADAKFNHPDLSDKRQRVIELIAYIILNTKEVNKG